MNALGYSRGEGWAGGLLLPPGPAKESADFLYSSDVIGWVRFMAKFEEYELDPESFQRNTIDKAEAARALGLDFVFCIDFHKVATGPDDYHAARWFPQNIRRAVRNIIRAVGLTRKDRLEVGNEPSYIKRPTPRMTVEEYADIVDSYASGAAQAGFNGQIWAEHTTSNWSGDLSKRWEFTSQWAHGMSEVRHSFVLDRRSTDPQEFAQQIRATFWREDKPWKGAEHPLNEDEFSSTGKQVHCNSQNAYDMTIAACETYRSLKVPFGWLTMGGDTDGWPRPGQTPWGMSTVLTRRDGAFSRVARALADDAGVTLPDVGNGNGNGNGVGGDQYTGTVRAVRAMERAAELRYNLQELKQDGKFQRNFKQWHRKWGGS